MVWDKSSALDSDVVQKLCKGTYVQYIYGSKQSSSSLPYPSLFQSQVEVEHLVRIPQCCLKALMLYPSEAVNNVRKIVYAYFIVVTALSVIT